MNLLNNAIGSVRVGVEDSGSADPARLLAAIRNIHSGILLLYKEALRRRSPAGSEEVLLKALIRPRQNPDGTVKFVGKGRKTVDIQQIKDRFSELEIRTNWKRFERVSELRNDAEHYYPDSASAAQLRTLISDAFVLVRDFMRTELREDPRTLLGESAWKQMLHVAEIYLQESKECENELQAILWKSEALERGIAELLCAGCGSQLLHPNNVSGDWYNVKLTCGACGLIEEADSFVPRAVARALEDEMSLSSDGNELPYVTCGECLKDTYVIDENRCALCGNETVDTCVRCLKIIPPDELEYSPFCVYCYNKTRRLRTL